MASKFRTAFYKLVPEHFARGEGELVLYALTRILDAYDAIFRDGLQARFPSYAGAKALELIGADRGIFRGRSETTTHYIARLRRWRYPRGHRTRGSAFALLEQICEYWGGMTVATYDVNQTVHARSADGTQETFQYDTGWDWDGTGPDEWSRFWLVLVPGTDQPQIIAWPTMGTGLTWGGGTFADIAARGVTLGQQGVTPGDIRAMRRFFHGTFQWKPAGTRTDYAILVLGSQSAILDDAIGGSPEIVDDSRPGSPTIVENSSTIDPPVPAGLWGTLRGRVTNAPNTVRFWRVGTVVIP